MKYELTQIEINKQCAELNGFAMMPSYNPCNNPADEWPIIEQCWDDLIFVTCGTYETVWEELIYKHQCTALEAACIYFIEVMKADD